MTSYPLACITACPNNLRFLGRIAIFKLFSELIIAPASDTHILELAAPSSHEPNSNEKSSHAFFIVLEFGGVHVQQSV